VPMKKHERLVQCFEQNPEEAVMMHFSISRNCSRQIRCYRECHRSGGLLERFNVAALLLQLPSVYLGLLLSNSGSNQLRSSQLIHPISV
jgi:hypothetical protein